MLRAAVVPTTVGGSANAAQAVGWRNSVGFGSKAVELAAAAGLRKARRAIRNVGRLDTVRVCARVAEERDLTGEAIAEDYYSILGLTSDATPDEIKKAYYACMKACHPDLSNNHPDSVAFCSFVNEVYEVLSDPEMRAVYDEIKGYSVNGDNPFFSSRFERDQAFVDEFTCIGCKNCANTAEGTFIIEELWGRARVSNQEGDSPAKVQEAIDTCPVSCIHWVTSPQLALLEDEMRRMERVSVGVMQAGQGNKGSDVFAQASRRWEKRRMKALERARVKAYKEKGNSKWTQTVWDIMGGGEPRSDNGAATGDGAESGDTSSAPASEKYRRAAAAARRWREYSRQGVDRRRVMALGDGSESDDMDRSAEEERNSKEPALL